MFTSRSMRWMWQSIRPGISVRPRRSTRVALAAPIGRSDDFLDAIVLDQHVSVVDQRVAPRVEQATAVEQI